MRIRLLILIACMGLACQRPTPQPVPIPDPVPTPTPVPIPEPQPTPTPVTIATQLLDAHNQSRAAKGLRPLALNPQLVKAAQSHSDFMAARGKLAHSGIGDGSPWDRIAAAGYRMSSAAENVAWNQQGVNQVMKSWMNSPGHRSNILGAYREFGGAVAYGKDGSPYWTTDFGTPGAAAVGRIQAAPEPPEDLTVTPSGGGHLIPPVQFGQP